MYEHIRPDGTRNPSYFWVAPENLAESPTDTRSDIWGFGCLAYELATMAPPYYADARGSVDELFRLYKRKAAIKYPENISYGFDSFMRSCLQVEPHERTSIMELQTDLFITSAQCNLF